MPSPRHVICDSGVYIDQSCRLIQNVRAIGTATNRTMTAIAGERKAIAAPHLVDPRARARHPVVARMAVRDAWTVMRRPW
ncbi:hypothetical protein GCM10009530_41000 [Microbispora corallina]